MSKATPMNNWPLQSSALVALSRQFDSGKLPHAMLFIGSDGATSTAVHYVAKLLLCEGNEVPCGTCSACLQFEAGNHPDYYVIEPSGTGAVKTADIEDVQAHLKLRSHHGGRIVYVISHIDDATPVAANRLLKGLEEPSSPVIALMTAETPSRVLPTIRSRAFIYQLEDSEQYVATLLEPMIQWSEAWLVKREPSLILAKRLLDMAASASLADVFDTLLVLLQRIMHHRVGVQGNESLDERASALAQVLSATGFARAIEQLIDAKLRVQAHVGAQSNVEQLCIRLREVG
jgi:DNA polymerase III subunit delta'